MQIIIGAGNMAPGRIHRRRRCRRPVREQLAVSLVSIRFVGGSRRVIRCSGLLNGGCVAFGPDSDIVHDFTH
jgi:hypothetical protein